MLRAASCRGERVVGVGQAEDACAEGHLLASQTVGVAAAVEPLVVVADQRQYRLHGAQRPADALTEQRMLHDRPNSWSSRRPCLVEQGLGHPDLADVVELAGDAEDVAVRLGHSRGRRPSWAASTPTRSEWPRV